MADDMEAMLRNSLNAVDRGRRWAVLGVVALFVAIVLALGAVLATAQASAAPPAGQLGAFKVLFVAAIAQMLLVACCTGIVMFHVSRVRGIAPCWATRSRSGGSRGSSTPSRSTSMRRPRSPSRITCRYA